MHVAVGRAGLWGAAPGCQPRQTLPRRLAWNGASRVIERAICRSARPADHHKTNVCIGTALPPPSRMSTLGPDVDTDHAVVIAAAAIMTAMVMLRRMSSSTWIEYQAIGIAAGGETR